LRHNFAPHHWSLDNEEQCQNDLIAFFHLISQFTFVIIAILFFIKFCTLLDMTFANSGSDCRTIVLPHYISNTSFAQILSLAMFLTIDIIIIGFVQCACCVSCSLGNLFCGFKWCCVGKYHCFMHNFLCCGWTLILLFVFGLTMGFYTFLITLGYCAFVSIFLAILLLPYIILMLCVVPRAFCSYGFPYACDGYIYIRW